MSCGEKPYRAEAANAVFGRRQLTCVDYDGTTPAALDGASFKVSSLTTKYQPYYDVDGGSVVPTPAAGYTLVEIDINSTDNIAAIIAATEAALEALEGGQAFYGTAEGLSKLSIETFDLGQAADPSADVDTGLTVSQLVEGSISDLGCLAEDFEISPELSEAEITCHQEGENKIDSIFTGLALEIELGLLDTSKERIKQMVGQGVGQTYTPAGGSELIGMGTASLGKSAFDVGGELRIVPVNDPTRAWVFPLVLPKFSSLSYSAVEKQVLTVSFSALVDRKVRPEVNFGYCGVVGQDVR